MLKAILPQLPAPFLVTVSVSRYSHSYWSGSITPSNSFRLGGKRSYWKLSALNSRIFLIPSTKPSRSAFAARKFWLLESSIHEMLHFQTYLCSCQGSWLNITKLTTACALVSLDESSFLSTLCQQRGCLGMKGGWSLCSARPAANFRQFGLPQRFPFAGERLLDGG